MSRNVVTLRRLIDRLDPPRTRAAIAAECGITRRHLQRLIAGEKCASLHTAHRLAAALGANRTTVCRLTVSSFR